MRGERILLIEDEPANIHAVSAVLRAEGYQISAATSGEQALELLTRIRPDLILLDVGMPGIDGFTTCQRIKAKPAWSEIPIIFLTARTDTSDIVRGFEVGALDYVGKPFNAPELLARVHTHLSIDRLNQENRRLLLNILPESIAEQLKKNDGLIAERVEDVSVIFADLVGFTPLSAHLPPVRLLELLSRVFGCFDDLVEKHGLEKIKTIGDAYMAAGGIPEPHPDHLAATALLGLDMIESVRSLRSEFGGLSLRVGMHTGSVIAGVIGRRKFIYDIWGMTVNTASRLESHSEPDRLQVSEVVFRRLQSRFDFEPRGIIELKGYGPTNTYFLTGEKST